MFLIIITFLLLLIYAYYELEYLISNEFLLIKWGIKTTKISISAVKRVIKPEPNHYEGIRLGGVGIPGYLFGKFKYLIEGKFETVSLYATKLDKLLFIETGESKRKFYGITPNQDEELIRVLNDMNKSIEPKVKEKTIPFKKSKFSSRDLKFALSLFLISIVLSITGFFYFIFIYFQLPQIVPLHFTYNLVPDTYGNKLELIGVISLFLIFGIGLSSLIYYYIHKRTHLDKTKYGYSIMMVPLVINIIFLVLTIVTLNQILVFT